MVLSLSDSSALQIQVELPKLALAPQRANRWFGASQRPDHNLQGSNLGFKIDLSLGLGLYLGGEKNGSPIPPSKRDQWADRLRLEDVGVALIVAPFGALLARGGKDSPLGSPLFRYSFGT